MCGLMCLRVLPRALVCVCTLLRSFPLKSSDPFTGAGVCAVAVLLLLLCCCCVCVLYVLCCAVEKGSVELKVAGGEVAENHRPKPANLVRPAIDLNVSWLLQRLTERRQTAFRIDRSDAKKCCTPRRNPDIEQALGFFSALSAWSSAVSAYLTGQWMSVQTGHGIDIGSASNASAVFVPVVALFEKNHTQKGEAKAERKGGDDSKALVLARTCVSLHCCTAVLLRC
jgi:hypothetical protein